MRRMPVDEHLAAVELLLAEHRPQQARLAGAVATQHGDELAGADVEVEAAPESSGAKAERPAADAEHRGGVGKTVVERHDAVSASATASMFARIHET